MDYLRLFKCQRKLVTTMATRTRRTVSEHFAKHVLDTFISYRV